jgi:lysophospholipase L1-like esterase
VISDTFIRDKPDVSVLTKLSKGEAMRFLFVICLAITSSLTADEAATKWEPSIAEFEKSDQESPPPKNAVLFVGSSSIRRWDLTRYFPHLPTINRGFGGSQMSDTLFYADRIVFPYEPKVIVVYAGDNDIAAGESAAQVEKDFVAFVRRVHTKLPRARIFYVAIKPSIKRWQLVEEMRKANQAICTLTSADPLVEFVDIDTPMIGADGMPRKELFASDGLHLNHDGYVLWSKLVNDAIEKSLLKQEHNGKGA